MRPILLLGVLALAGLGAPLAGEEEAPVYASCADCSRNVKEDALVCGACGKAVVKEEGRWLCLFCKQNVDGVCEGCYEKREEERKK